MYWITYSLYPPRGVRNSMVIHDTECPYWDPDAGIGENFTRNYYFVYSKPNMLFVYTQRRALVKFHEKEWCCGPKLQLYNYIPRQNNPTDASGCIVKASPMFTNALQNYRRSSADVSPTISANYKQLSLNVRQTLEHVADATANIRWNIASAGILCSTSQGIGKHHVYNYTFHHRRCKNPQWDRGITKKSQNHTIKVSHTHIETPQPMPIVWSASTSKANNN